MRAFREQRPTDANELCKIINKPYFCRFSNKDLPKFYIFSGFGSKKVRKIPQKIRCTNIFQKYLYILNIFGEFQGLRLQDVGEGSIF